MKGFYKIFIIVCFFVFSLLFITSTAQCQPWNPYQSPPININLNLGGFPGISTMGYNNYMGYPPPGAYYGPTPFSSGVIGGTDPYGNQWMTYLPPTSASIKAATAKFSFMHSAADEDYIYVVFQEAKGQSRMALAIFKASGSDDCEYLSHVVLSGEGGYGDYSFPGKIIIHGDLAVIGANDKGTVYLVDISDKEEPELNKLVLGRKYQSGGRSGVTGLAIEDEVLFVSIEFLGSDKNIIFSLDISDPEETDEDDDLLDSYILDDDDYQEIYNMVSAPGYLYISGRYKYDPTILVMDISNPENLSLVETLDMEGEDEVSVAINGDYLLATVQVEDYSGLLYDGACEFKIIDISAPEDPEIISSSDEFSGRHMIGYENMVIKDNYAYVFVTTRDPTETKIYVFDISNPEDPDLVEKSRSVDGLGGSLYFVDDRLGLHTSQIIKIFDISDPENLSVDETVDMHDILEDELDGWGEERSSSSYYGGYPQYGYGYFPPTSSPFASYIPPSYPSFTSYMPPSYPPFTSSSYMYDYNTLPYTPSNWNFGHSNYYGYGPPSFYDGWWRY